MECVKSVEKLKYIQAWSFVPETTAESVTNYMKKIASSEKYDVQKRVIKTDTHASFLIGIPESLFETFTTASAWPPRVKFTN